MTNHSSRAGSATIQPIQYLRGIAALMVVWHHARSQFPAVQELFPGAFGATGVDLFFVISGFIMVVTTDGSSTSCAQFVRRRFIRVAPLYWLLTLTMVAAALVVPSAFKSLKFGWESLALSLAFVPHYSDSFPDAVLPVLVPGWTLNYEMFFYLVFGLLLFLRPAWRLPVLTAAFASLVASGLVWGPFQPAALQVYTSPLLLEFVAGAWIGLAWRRGHCNPPAPVGAFLVVAGFPMLTLGNVGMLDHVNELLGASMVVAGALSPRFLSIRLPVWGALGDSSYSLYLTHLFTLGVLRLAWSRLPVADGGWVSGVSFMAVALVTCGLIGHACYKWIEVPLLSWLSSATARKPSRGSLTSRYRPGP